ncbi:hypothetical protein AVDCRST_MAG84-5681 [uncultured Microcoleus sp.]|uniref:Uncharacterized protein n=1 Tax=uncultured Microcoleus sp. TaxID=259945 RepID=A0A6J4NPV0_9CYAN|nr:hypothetical protein AVDCRST_MAG84-5681 [uncultured Microcoleus sp.]
MAASTLVRERRIHPWSEKKAPHPHRKPPELSVGSLSSI